MEKKINLEEIIKPYKKYLVEGIDGYKSLSGDGMFVGDVLEAMKEACKQALKLAAENAKAYPNSNGQWVASGVTATVNKQSILNTINQVV